MPLLYLLACYVLAPIYGAALLWRGLRERGYWRGFGERFGCGTRLPQPVVWLHAASVGEVQAAAVVVAALRRERPQLPLAVTATTAAGLARAQALFAAEGIDVRYLPLDLPGSVRRFLERVRPQLAVILETEIWPNLFVACARRGVPLVLASARISERSLRRYLRLRGIFRRALAGIALAAAQTPEDAQRLQRLGVSAERVRVVGNIKADFTPPPSARAAGEALRQLHAAARPLWVAGSTHAGEEREVLAAHRLVRESHGDALLALAPRHPQRFEEVAAWLRREQVRFVRHSNPHPAAAGTEVLLVDSLGVLLDFYAAGDVAFVGGSLTPVGGHNLLEPAALARPILTGPYTFNGREIAAALGRHGALRVVADGVALAAAVSDLLQDPTTRARMGAGAQAALAENRGALERMQALISPLLPSGAGPPPVASGPAAPLSSATD